MVHLPVEDSALVLIDDGAEPTKEHVREQHGTRYEYPTARPVVQIDSGAQHHCEQRHGGMNRVRAAVGYVVAVAGGVRGGVCVCHVLRVPSQRDETREDSS